MRYTFLLLYLASIVAANWLIRHVGVPIPGGTHLLPVGFGLLAPSGTYAAALTLVMRDLVQRTSGRWWGIAVIPAGAAISALWDVHLAVASGLAFLLSEALDFLVYTPLQKRLTTAVAFSAPVGAIVDSLTFLTLAGIPLAIALPGQLVGKGWAILVATALIALVSRRWRREFAPWPYEGDQAVYTGTPTPEWEEVRRATRNWLKERRR